MLLPVARLVHGAIQLYKMGSSDVESGGNGQAAVMVDGGVMDGTKIVADGLRVVSCQDIFYRLGLTCGRYGDLL